MRVPLAWPPERGGEGAAYSVMAVAAAAQNEDLTVVSGRVLTGGGFGNGGGRAGGDVGRQLSEG